MAHLWASNQYVFRVTVSNVALNIGDENETQEHHPVLAVVGTSGLEPLHMRMLLPITAPVTQEISAFVADVHPTRGRRGRNTRPRAIFFQLHTIKAADNGEPVEYMAAQSDDCVWLDDPHLADGPVHMTTKLVDFPARYEVDVWHTVSQHDLSVRGPTGEVWTTKATADITVQMVHRPPVLETEVPRAWSLAYFKDVTNKNARGYIKEVIQYYVTRESQMLVDGLMKYCVPGYIAGPGLEFPSAVMLNQRLYAYSTEEALYRSRLLDVLHIRRFPEEEFTQQVKLLIANLLLLGRSKADTMWSRDSMRDQCMSVVIEALLTLPMNAMPYVVDVSNIPENRKTIEVERIDSDKSLRDFDCEDDSIEISQCYMDLVSKRNQWQDPLVQACAKLLWFFELVVSKTACSVQHRPDGSIAQGTLHIVPLLVLRQELYRWLYTGLRHSGKEGRTVVDRADYLAAETICFKPEWFYDLCVPGHDKTEDDIHMYFQQRHDAKLVYNGNYPCRPVYVCEGTGLTNATLGPPQMTMPAESDVYSTLLRERVEFGRRVVKLIGAHQDPSFSVPVLWDANAPLPESNAFYKYFVSIAVRSPVFQLATAFPNGTFDYKEIERTFIDCTFHTMRGDQCPVGVTYTDLFATDHPPICLIPNARVSPALMHMMSESLAIIEPVTPLHRREPDFSLPDVEKLNFGPDDASDVFCEFRMHPWTFDPKAIRQMLRTLGTEAKACRVYVLNTGAAHTAVADRFMPADKFDALVRQITGSDIDITNIQTLARVDVLRQQLEHHHIRLTPAQFDEFYRSLYEWIFDQPLLLLHICVYKNTARKSSSHLAY